MSAPQTGLELTGDWTTLEYEWTFLDAVAAGSDGRAVVEVAGQSGQGRDIALVRVGYPAAESIESGAQKGAVLIVGCQHGDEPAGREAALQLIRDLAYSTDPSVQSYLAAHPVYIVPTASPDARNNNSRTFGGNLNREHFSLAMPESRVLATIMRDLRPHLVLDLHERHAGGSDVEYLPNRHMRATGQIKDLSAAVIADAVIPAAVAAGRSHRTYTVGLHTEGTLGNSASLRHACGLLLETPLEDPDKEYRVATHVTVVNAILDYHAANADTIAEAVAGSRASAEARGTEGFLNDPAAYELTPEQLVTVAYHLDSFHILEDEGVVSMAQAANTVIPVLLDGSSEHHVVAATRIPFQPGDKAWPFYFRTGGQNAPIKSVHLRIAGQTVEVARVRGAPQS